MKNVGYTTDAKGFQEFTNKELVPKFGQQEAYRIAHDLGRALEGTGQWWAGRSYKAEYDPATRETKYAEIAPDKAEQESYRVWSRTYHPQQQARNTHRTSYWSEAYDPLSNQVRDYGVSEGGRRRIQALSKRHAGDIQLEVQMGLLVNHAQELKGLNPEVYQELRARVAELEKSSPTEYAELEKNVIKTQNPAAATHWRNVP